MRPPIDKNLILAEGQALTSTDVATTNDHRLPSGQTTWPAIQQLFINIETDAAFTGGTSVNFVLQDAADNGSDAPDTYATTGVEKTVLTAALTADTHVWKVALPYGTREWFRIYMDVTGTFSTGSVNVWISRD